MAQACGTSGTARAFYADDSARAFLRRDVVVRISAAFMPDI